MQCTRPPEREEKASYRYRKVLMNMAFLWQWLPTILAVLIGVALPVIVNKWLNGRTRVKTPVDGTPTLKEYLQQGLTEADAKFQVAVDYVAAQANAKLSNEQRLTLYAFFKQATLGKCSGDKPSAVDMVARAKYESWLALGDMPKSIAKDQYTGLVKELFPQFDETGETNRRGIHPLAEKIQDADQYQEMSMAGVVSMPTVDKSAPEWKITKDAFHFASTGDFSEVEQALSNGANVQDADDHGRTMLHWAVDRAQTEVVELLLKHGASPNAQDSDGMTPLHYAVNCEEDDIAKLLVDHGAFVDIEDMDGETPLSCAQSKQLQAILAQGKSEDEE